MTDDTTPSDLHPDVAYALREVAGGFAIDSHHAEWPELGMVLEVPEHDKRGEHDRAVGSCATGAICAFSGSNLSGTRLSWSSCGTYSTSGLSSVGSIANARSAGYLQARTSSGSVVATAIAGSWSNTSGAVTNVRCVS
ncbi:hypothetical protein [Microbacterium sp. LMI1-1-1.1]|uniref:hypothetical protein n=1 Tax=Microbacterium sp. LMI1-1-1.1 TaxID=3135223 RepID=UPI003465CA12